MALIRTAMKSGQGTTRKKPYGRGKTTGGSTAQQTSWVYDEKKKKKEKTWRVSEERKEGGLDQGLSIGEKTFSVAGGNANRHETGQSKKAKNGKQPPS